MPKKHEEPIPLQFILFLAVMIAITVFYLRLPSTKDKEETEIRAAQNTAVQTVKKKAPRPNNTYSVAEYKQKLDNLLYNIPNYPQNSLSTTKIIINRLLSIKGYPQDLLKVNFTNINQAMSKVHGSYQVANFDFRTGEININQNLVSRMNNKLLAAALAHEVEHFDNIAQLCASMDTQNFIKLLEDNYVTNINRVFWDKAEIYANLAAAENISSYKEALERFVNKDNIDTISIYSNFFSYAENLRNPLEINAYKVSDYVLKYYNINPEDDAMVKLIKEFNDADWAVYSKISNYPTLANERIAFFDYYFIKASIKIFPQLKSKIDYCLMYKNSDLTEYWYSLKSLIPRFYNPGPMDKYTYDTMVRLLQETKNMTEYDLSNNEIAAALKCRINTLLSNLSDASALPNLKNTIIDYLKFTKYNNLISAKDELKYLSVLLCIENEIYNINKGRALDVNALKIPEALYDIYNIDQRNHFNFIYNNKAFTASIQSYTAKGKNITKEQALSAFLNKFRLNLKVVKY